MLGLNFRQRELAMRQRLLQKKERRVLIARLLNSKESEDPYTIVNCGGFGRVRNFSRFVMHFGTESRLREAHARSFLAPGYSSMQPVRTQVFQLSGCSWRCWYCYVDAGLLSGNPEVGSFLSCDELLDLFERDLDPPAVIDLSGGQPDLIPEWLLWMMESLESRGLRGKILLRSEDNLSNRFLWEFLSEKQRNYIATYPRYVRIGCIKGFDPKSFSFNTGAKSSGFNVQFRIIEDLIHAGVNLFLHTTWTGPEIAGIEADITRLMDRLQAIDENLPLRVVPLRIRRSPAMLNRLKHFANAELVQQKAYAVWEGELERRFSVEEMNHAVGDITLRSAVGVPEIAL